MQQEANARSKRKLAQLRSMCFFIIARRYTRAYLRLVVRTCASTCAVDAIDGRQIGRRSPGRPVAGDLCRQSSCRLADRLALSMRSDRQVIVC